MGELTDATGGFHFARAWSWFSLEVPAAGDALELSSSASDAVFAYGDPGEPPVRAAAAEPLTLVPNLLLFPEGAHILMPDVPFGGGVVAGAEGVPECSEDGLMLAPELSGNVYLPAEVDGVRIGVAILQWDGDLLFWVEAHGGDRERARTALEGLAITPQGAWADPAAALGLAPPAELEPRLSEFSTILEDGSTVGRCPLRQAPASQQG